MPKNPYNKLLFDNIDGFEFFLIFWFPMLSYLPLLQEGTAAEFQALGSSHKRPCSIVICSRVSSLTQSAAYL